MISIKNVEKSFTTKEKTDVIFKDLNLEIKDWEFISIIWKSGSWKTTFLNMLSWISNFNSWEINVNWLNYSNVKSDFLTKFRWENISFIFQQFHLIPNLNVRENIELTIDINNIKPRFTIEEILEKVWLSNKINSYPSELSWGEQQRVAIARAFVWDTKILLADEPTGNLDEENSKNIIDILLKLHKETKNTIVLITHDKDIALLWDKMYELKEKELLIHQ